MPLAQRRLHRIAVSSFFFLAGICFASWASRIPDIQARLQLNSAALGGVLLCLPVGLLTSLPIAGFLVAKYGSRIIVMLAAILYSCTLTHAWFFRIRHPIDDYFICFRIRWKYDEYIRQHTGSCHGRFVP